MTSAASTHSDEPAGSAQMKRRKSEVRSLLPFLCAEGGQPVRGQGTLSCLPYPSSEPYD